MIFLVNTARSKSRFFYALNIFNCLCLVFVAASESENYNGLSTNAHDSKSNSTLLMKRLQTYAEMRILGGCEEDPKHKDHIGENCSLICKDLSSFGNLEFHGKFDPKIYEIGETTRTFVDHDRKENMVLFRGSQELNDWITDGLFKLTPYKPQSTLRNISTAVEQEKLCKGCKVHYGFWKSFNKTWDFIKSEFDVLNEKYPDYSWTIIGHSLGGAIAQLVAIEFKLLGIENPLILSFGSPQLGNKKFVEFIDNFFKPKETIESLSYGVLRGNIRFVNRLDVVPTLPGFQFSYEYNGVELLIMNNELPTTFDSIVVCDPNSYICQGNKGDIWKEAFNACKDTGKAHEMFYAHTRYMVKTQEGCIGKLYRSFISIFDKICDRAFLDMEY